MKTINKRIAKWVEKQTGDEGIKVYAKPSDWKPNDYAPVTVLEGEAIGHWDPQYVGRDDVIGVVISEAAETYGPYGDPWTYCGFKGLPFAFHNEDINDTVAGTKYFTEALNHYAVAIYKDVAV